MEISGQAVLLRVFVGESDKLGHMPLYEAIVKQARDADLAGATVLKGVPGLWGKCTYPYTEDTGPVIRFADGC